MRGAIQKCRLPPLHAKLRLSISHRERLRDGAGELDKCDCALKQFGIRKGALPRYRLPRKGWGMNFALQLQPLCSPFEFAGFLTCHCLLPPRKLVLNVKCALRSMSE